MNTQGVVSVAIPTYNRLWALPRVVAQFYNEPLVGEILVVNDASTDGTKEWLEEEAPRQPLLRSVHHARNRGPTAARNTAIEAARFEYLFFWDDDMLLVPSGGLQILLNELLRYGGDIISPATWLTEGQPLPDLSLPDDQPGELLFSNVLFNRWTLTRRNIPPSELPERTFQSPILSSLTLQRRAIFGDLRYAADLGPTYFREETDVHLALQERGCKLLACPFVVAVDLKRPKNLADGGCHSQGILLRYDWIACRNNWRMLKRRQQAIRRILGIRLPIWLLQAIFVCHRFLYKLPRKFAGFVLRKAGLKR